ncbi:MAG TPA: GNAT family N-acetyltransferase [Campylobacterales bacterium]|nr:GNAT family N-acetyltransferase [Campylobacterales bacterium]HIP59727.1 GNAT family N-acetyltransferase [Campylobacterales bacterium]
MTIKQYNESLKNSWNDFLSNAKNYHFFFHRDYLAYHGNRFKDFSLLIYDTKGKLIALLPANINNNILYSHQGLTYGGFIVNDNMKAEIMLEIFETVKNFLIERKIQKVIYKTIPYIHHLKPAEEDLYALFIQNATLIQRDIGAVVNLGKPLKYSNGRKWSLKKAKNEGFVIEESQDFASFWTLLEEILKQQHDSEPVHSIEEIKHLNRLFPKNIRLFLTKKEDKILAGGIIFDNPEITHLQYVANSNEGRQIGALDFLIDHLIRETCKDKKYFDFGTSNEENGRVLNMGLIDQKERFGARAVTNDRYVWDIS